MTLNTPLTEALLSFRLQLNEEDVICWNKALVTLCIFDLVPASDYDMRLMEMQCMHQDYETAWNLPFDYKLIFLSNRIENDSISLYYCFKFLFKFYDYLRRNCPEFKIGWNLTSCPKEEAKEHWVELTTFFAMMEEEFSKCGFSLKELMKTCQPTIETPVEKVVTELKDQIVCAQIDYDETVWENLKYSPIEGDEVYEEIF